MLEHIASDLIADAIDLIGGDDSLDAAIAVVEELTAKLG
jgi:hypothetical protein